MSLKSVCKFSKTVKLAADRAKHLFVESDGSLPEAGKDALGTTERAGKKNERVGVLVLGQGIAVASEAIAVGKGFKVTATGKAAVHTDNTTLVGRALTAAAADGDEFEYIAIPN